MPYVLRTVAHSDIEGLVRYCDHPAMQANPLNRTMFPNASPETEEEEIMWHTSSFRESFEKDPGACFRMICTDDGVPVGLALWTLDQPVLRTETDKVESRAEAMKTPDSLDMNAWREISRQLAAEKQRVLKDWTNVWSESIYTFLNITVVDRAYSRTRCPVGKPGASTSRMRVYAFNMGLRASRSL
jgi:hypothetical protein